MTDRPPVWIDATRPASARQLWGMHLVERQVREMALRGCRRFTLLVTEQTRAASVEMRADLHRLYDAEIEALEVADERAVFAHLAHAEEALVLLAGDAVYDDRVLGHVLAGGRGCAVVDGPRAALFLGVEECAELADKVGHWSELVAWASARLEVCSAVDLDPYVASLRLHMPAYIYLLQADGDLRTVDHLMYRRTFKGAIDGVARYGYYHLVRWITRHLARGRSTPNFYTVLSVLCVWGASPLIASGWVGAGLAVAWGGVILDSIDGKLARLRLHLSDAMGAFEHVAAMPGLALWFLAIGWHISEGQLLVAEPIALSTWIMLLLFLTDKVCSGLFKKWVGRELFDYRPVDARFHLVAARRNIALLLLTIGALTNALLPWWYGLVGWMALTLVFHLGRLVWVLLSLRAGRAAANF